MKELRRRGGCPISSISSNRVEIRVFPSSSSFSSYLTEESASDGEKFVKVALFLVQQFAHQHELEKGLVGQSEAPPLLQHGLQANILREIEHVQKGLQEARRDTCWVGEGGILQSFLRKYGQMLTAGQPSIQAFASGHGRSS